MILSRSNEVVLQSVVAMLESVLQCVAVVTCRVEYVVLNFNLLQHTATYCNILPHTATHSLEHQNRTYE